MITQHKLMSYLLLVAMSLNKGIFNLKAKIHPSLPSYIIM